MNTQIPRSSSQTARTGDVPRYSGAHKLGDPLEPESVIDDRARDIDVRALLLIIWRRKLVLAVSISVFTIIGVLVAAHSAPQYFAAARVLISTDRLNVVNVDQVLVSPEANRDYVINQVQVILSTALLGRVLDDLQLDQTPEFNPSLRVQAPSLLDQAKRSLIALRDRTASTIVALSSDQEHSEGHGEAAASEGSEPPQNERAAMIRALRGGLRVLPLSNSQVIEIGFTSTNPRLGAQIANSVAEQFVVEQVEAQLHATRSATNWLTEQADTLEAQVREAEAAVEGLRSELRQAAGPGAQATAQQLEVFVGALATARATRSALEVRHEVVSQALASNRDLAVVPEFRRSPIIDEYRRRLSSLRDEEVAVRALRSADLAELRVLEARIADARAEMRLEAELIAASLAAELAAAEVEERALLDQIAVLEQKALVQAQEELRLRGPEREAATSRSLYETVFARLNEMSLQEFQSPGARLLTSAEPAAKPVPNQLTVIMSSLVGGLFGLVIIYLLEQLNATFRSIGELEGQIGYPVLATIPEAGSRRRLPKLLEHLLSQPSSSFAESVRNLGTSILHSNVDHPPRVVLVTSSFPAEGKSTISLLLALTAQSAGRSALVIDCDFRRPSIYREIFEGKSAGSLLSVLDGTAEAEEAVAVEPRTGLHLLVTHPNQRRGLNAADILSSRQFVATVRRLRERYDLIILDTPPVLLVTDARVAAAAADAVIYGVRCGHSSKRAVAEGIRELRSVHAPLIGTVLTRVSAKISRRHAREGYGYHGRRHRYYYGA